MQFINLFWVWGHPEVYIVVLPAFGVYSEVVSTFSKKTVFGYKSMVFSLIAITVIGYLTWVHHFFTMGAGASVNTFFAISTMCVGIPTGVKMFNWLFTMFRGRIQFKLPMLWTLAFIPAFAIAGATGIMLAAAPADYQFHNSQFLVAHFHMALIGGVVFGYIAGMYYWWPKLFGFSLDERLGRWAFWLWQIGFYVCFGPQFALGFMGMTRRMYTYPANMGWNTLNLVSTGGAYLMGIAIPLHWCPDCLQYPQGRTGLDWRSVGWPYAWNGQFLLHRRCIILRRFQPYRARDEWWRMKLREKLDASRSYLRTKTCIRFTCHATQAFRS